MLPEQLVGDGLPSPALLLGIVFDLLLFGILTAQIYIYYLSFPKDRVLLKIAVVWVYLVGVAQTGLALVDLYASAMKKLFQDVQVDNDPNHQATYYLSPDHLWLSITTSTTAVAIVIQAFYAHRIYLLSKKLWLATIIICMSIGQLGAGIVTAWHGKGMQAISSIDTISGYVRLGGITFLVGLDPAWGPTSAVCDLTITICMVTIAFTIQLVKQRERTMRRRTRLHITRIVQIVAEAGMATTILMIIYTILYTWPIDQLKSPPWHPLPGLMMSKVYSNSMLVLLNNRATIANGRNEMESFEFIEVSA